MQDYLYEGFEHIVTRVYWKGMTNCVMMLLEIFTICYVMHIAYYYKINNMVRSTSEWSMSERVTAPLKWKVDARHEP